MTEQDLREMSNEDLVQDYKGICEDQGEMDFRGEHFVKKELLRRLEHYNAKSI